MLKDLWANWANHSKNLTFKCYPFTTTKRKSSLSTSESGSLIKSRRLASTVPRNISITWLLESPKDLLLLWNTDINSSPCQSESETTPWKLKNSLVDCTNQKSNQLKESNSPWIQMKSPKKSRFLELMPKLLERHVHSSTNLANIETSIKESSSMVSSSSKKETWKIDNTLFKI